MVTMPIFMLIKTFKIFDDVLFAPFKIAPPLCRCSSGLLLLLLLLIYCHYSIYKYIYNKLGQNYMKSTKKYYAFINISIHAHAHTHTQHTTLDRLILCNLLSYKSLSSYSFTVTADSQIFLFFRFAIAYLMFQHL